MTIRGWRIGAFTVALLLAGSEAGSAQVVIKVNDDVNFKLGVLGQFQADTIEDSGTGPSSNNPFVRRLRLLFGGQVAKNVTFFVETDTPNLGKTLPTGKNSTPATIVQDAYGEFKASDAFALDAGLMFVPFSRNSVQSAATLLAIDYGAYTFSQSAPTQSSTGRDTGFQAKGYFLANHLQHRIGAFQGARDARSHASFRCVGRVQYNILDTETDFFYTGTSVGKRNSWLWAAPSTRSSTTTGMTPTCSRSIQSGPGRSRPSSTTTGSTATSRCRPCRNRTTSFSRSGISSPR